MSEPKVTLAQILQAMRAQTTPELELAIADFLDLPDAEQKIVLFRALVMDSARMDRLEAQMNK